MIGWKLGSLANRLESQSLHLLCTASRLVGVCRDNVEECVRVQCCELGTLESDTGSLSGGCSVSCVLGFNSATPAIAIVHLLLVKRECEFTRDSASRLYLATELQNL